ncbi:hypothetical protein T01_10363 [Trichinella spiralis]|uniref:Uncharacterized protein n=1 Tax=Trichinella spiralis TaxID=6334 RepID=A0A0V1B667_TRISP|nr:hypothetical protein T01_10363 [Trichinella spiralis]
MDIDGKKREQKSKICYKEKQIIAQQSVELWSRRRRVWVRDWHRYHLNKRVEDSRRFSSTQTAGDNRSSNSTANCAVLKLH